jgi:Fe-S oxidoreductase
MGLDADRAVLARAGLDAEVLDAGCCGMAGSFGHEARHRDLSVKISEQRLLPRLRAAPPDALVIADGFSCRTQVEDLTGIRPRHTSEVLAMALAEARS